MQEETKRVEHQVKMKEYEAAIEQFKIEQVKVQQEERRKTLGEESKQQKARADYQDMLARKRQEDQARHQMRTQEEQLRRQVTCCNSGLCKCDIVVSL